MDEYLVSASQLKTFRMCRRRWGWEYIDRVPRTPNRFAQFGTDVHGMLEKWFKDGELPDPTCAAGEVALCILAEHPEPDDEMEVERHFLLETPLAHYQGYVDLAYDVEKVWIVSDHKTTTDFKWALTEEGLLTDPQAILYAAEALGRHDLSSVELQWTYGRTRGKAKAHPVGAHFGRGHVSHELAKIDVTAAEITRLSTECGNALELEPNVNSCDAFGGCPHKERCNLSSKERLIGLMAQETLKEKLERRKKEKAGQPVNPPEKATKTQSKPTTTTKTPKPAPKPTAAPKEPSLTASTQGLEAFIAHMRALGVKTIHLEL
jgi:hypothetical protein